MPQGIDLGIVLQINPQKNPDYFPYSRPPYPLKISVSNPKPLLRIVVLPYGLVRVIYKKRHKKAPYEEEAWYIFN